jgi:phytoene dehydrogenase-like protein
VVSTDTPDAIVVGSGPNGLAAAITIARAGRSVLVIEAAAAVGGGLRSAELTGPGYLHDVCSAIHPLVLGSPFFADISLADHGLEMIQPPAPLAHPFDDGTAAMLERSVDRTAAGLGSDSDPYARLMAPLAEDATRLMGDLLGPARLPRHPLALARFAAAAIRSADGLARARFAGRDARGLFAGIAAPSMLALEAPLSASFGLVLALLGHAVGWPLPRGGSQRIAEALASRLRSLGGEIVTGTEVRSIDELPAVPAILFDVGPRQLLACAGPRLPERYARRLAGYRYGPGVCKVDFALDGPIPWRAAECSRAATVHLGGTLEEIAVAERTVAMGGHPDRPFVLAAQQSLFDPTRAPAGKHTAWAYCHVPNGSSRDMSDSIANQIERFAPGFRDRIVARNVITAPELERRNANYVGGDINVGIQDLRQLFTRPVARLVPYTTSARGIYICSAATPPGGGVHGMCGYLAAQVALRRELR